MDRHFLKGVNTRKLQSSVQCARKIQLFVKDRHHQVNVHGNPDLSFHRIGTRAAVMLDAQVTFDPSERTTR